jgi:hypothetical protein
MRSGAGFGTRPAPPDAPCPVKGSVRQGGDRPTGMESWISGWSGGRQARPRSELAEGRRPSGRPAPLVMKATRHPSRESSRAQRSSDVDHHRPILPPTNTCAPRGRSAIRSDGRRDRHARTKTRGDDASGRFRTAWASSRTCPSADGNDPPRPIGTRARTYTRAPVASASARAAAIASRVPSRVVATTWTGTPGSTSRKSTWSPCAGLMPPA